MKQEWSKLLHSRTMIIASILIMMIPSIYVTLFLSSMWDPYGKVSNLPVAVVNQDTAVTYNGVTLNIGENLVDSLKKNDALKFYFVDREKADKGLENGDYYMVINIPENFSANASTLMSDHPEKMVLDYSTNPGHNYIASKMSESALAKIQESISDEVTSVYAETIFKQLGDIGSGMRDAADGTAKLSDGLGQLQNGSADLSEGLQTLSSSMLIFTDGMNTLSNGLDEYLSGVASVNTGAKDLADGSLTLANGAQKLNEAVQSISFSNISLTKEQQQQIAQKASDGTKVYADQLSAGIGSAVSSNITGKLKSEEVSSAITQSLLQNSSYSQMAQVLMKSGYTQEQVEMLFKGIVSASLNGAASQITADSINSAISQSVADTMSSVAVASAAAGADGVIDQVNQSLSKSNKKFDTLKISTKSLAAGASELNQGSQKLYEGTAALKAKNASITEGLTRLTDNSVKISNGVTKVYDGSIDLSNSLKEAAGGADTLNASLQDASSQITGSTAAVSDDTIDMLASPVESKENQVTTVTNNGHAMASYMLVLGIWLGCLAFCTIYPLKDVSGRSKSGISMWLGKISVLYPLALLWSLLAVFSLHVFLNFNPLNMGKTIVAASVAAITLMTIILFLNVVFDRIAALFILLIMIVQLSASQGTYPAELSAPFVSKITNFLPFTYIIRAFRIAISGGNGFTIDLLALAGFFVVFAVMTALYYYFMGKKKHEPSPEDTSEAVFN